MKNKHIAQSQWGAAHASTSVEFTQRTSQWQISPTSPWRSFVLSQNVRTCVCVLVFSAGGGGGGGRWGGGGGGGGELMSQRREGKEKNGEMDEGCLGAWVF